MPNLIVYELTGCPFCEKVTKTLEDLSLEYESREVPASKRDRTEVKEVSGQTGVPVLVDRDNGVTGMPESDDIVAYLQETYGNN